MFTRISTAARFIPLALALAVFPACTKKNTPPGSQAGSQPPQSTAPAVVEQPDASGPILSDDSQTLTGTELSGDEGPLHRIHFDYDASSINGDADRILSKNASYLKGKSSTFIRIEGHCDDRGSVEYNQALGEKRANAAMQYLVAQGVDTKRMETISYGEDRPISFDHTEYGWALNRRAEFRILSE